MAHNKKEKRLVRTPKGTWTGVGCCTQVELQKSVVQIQSTTNLVRNCQLNRKDKKEENEAWKGP